MPPIDELPGKIVTPTREVEKNRWKRSFRTRVPEADVGPGTQPDIDASVSSDTTMALYAKTKVISDNTTLASARGKALDEHARIEGVDPRKDAVGASGYVAAKTSSGGGTVQKDDELLHEATGLYYRVTETRHYTNGAAILVVGKSGGPQTNLPAGTTLKWGSPRPGFFGTVTVIEQADGSGLTGGRERETEDEFRDRIYAEKRNKAASGNDADYQKEAGRTPDVAVQTAFTYPAVTGTSSTCLVFTMRPARSGGSRVPNSAQVALVEAHVTGAMPGDDAAYYALIANENADIVYSVTWAEEAVGWEDLNPWPAYYETTPDSGPGAVIVDSVSSAIGFALKTANDDYTGIVQPQVGQTLAFFETDAIGANGSQKYVGAFRRKRIASILGTGPWDITVDTTNDVSDTSYEPVIGQRAMPWSDSLSALIPNVCKYFDTLGPGEQVASFYDGGRRQKRQPAAPRNWPCELTSKGLVGAITASEVDDVDAIEGDGLKPSVGSPGVLSNILKLRFLSAFPQL